MVIMSVFEGIDDGTKQAIIDAWKKMSESEKMHFINQVSLALTVWGTDEIGKKAVVNVLRSLVNDGSSNLSDFGLYIDRLYGEKDFESRINKIKRAALIIEGYRIKNSLPSEPHKEL
jgi:hypothetical protein